MLESISTSHRSTPNHAPTPTMVSRSRFVPSGAHSDQMDVEVRLSAQWYVCACVNMRMSNRSKT